MSSRYKGKPQVRILGDNSTLQVTERLSSTTAAFGHPFTTAETSHSIQYERWHAV